MKIFKCLTLILMVTGSLTAYDDRPHCYKDLQRDFFNYEVVGQALSMNYIGQAQWNKIIVALQARQGEADKLIKEKAKRLYPNPFENPFQPDVAKNLLLETMYQIFERTMVDNGYFDVNAIRIMFNYIVTQNTRIQACLPTK